MSVFQCKLCKIVHLTKFKSWFHLLKVHGIRQNREDEKCWEEIILLDLKLTLTRLTYNFIKTATNRKKIINPIRLIRGKLTAAQNKADGVILVQGSKRFKCAQCGHMFKRRCNLLAHIKSIHLNFKNRRQKELRHSCPHCNASFKAKNLLEYHELIHSSDWDTLSKEEQHRRRIDKQTLLFEQSQSTFECSRCQEKFTDEGIYKAHYRSHDDKERPHKCKNCGAAYAQKWSLQIHLRENKCEKFKQAALGRAYQCEICFTCLKTKKLLSTHKWAQHGIHKVQQPLLRHSCPHCNASFKAKNLLEYHQLIHSSDWDTLSKDEQHRRRIDKQTLLFEQSQCTFECSRCQEKFTDEGIYKAHYRSHDDKERPHKCKNCGAAYAQKWGLQIHVRENKCEKFKQAALDRAYQCEICFTCLKTKKLLSNHKWAQHGIHKVRQPLQRVLKKCLLCDFASVLNYELARHNRTHTGEKLFPCPHCSASFKAKNLLEYHQLIHSSDWDTLSKDEQHRRRIDKETLLFEQSQSTFECSRCQEKFTDEGIYKAHYRSHDDKERPHKCKNCGASFSKNWGLQIHLSKNKCEKFKQAALDRAYECEICFACLKTKNGLSNHKWAQHGIHEVQQPLQRVLKKCLLCDYACVSPYELASHNRTHTGEKPFACEACGAQFPNSSNMRKHMRNSCSVAKEMGLADKIGKETKLNRIKMRSRIQRPKPFNCSICGLQFFERQHKNNHMKRHGDNHKCEFCGIGYVSPKSLSVHKTIAHPEELGCLRCDVCCKSYVTRNSLLKHYKDVHGGYPPVWNPVKRCSSKKNVVGLVDDKEDPLRCVPMDEEKVGLKLEEMDVDVVKVEEELDLVEHLDYLST